MLLLAITWIIRLTQPIFTIPDILFIQEPIAISVRDLILILGGLFLLAKSVSEMHHKVDDMGEHEVKEEAKKTWQNKYGSYFGANCAIRSSFFIRFNFNSHWFNKSGC